VRRAGRSGSYGPTWQAVPGGVLGCPFCVSLRELFTFNWETDRLRFSRLFGKGGVSFAFPVRIMPASSGATNSPRSG
jgi:hypothetical protein